MNDELAFNSKIDLWLLILILTAVSICLWALAAIWDSGDAIRWGAVAALAVGILLPLWVVVSLKYFLSDDNLRIRCGPFKWSIPIRDISAVTPTNSPWSSPALSLDRLSVVYGGGHSIMISPEPRAEFLRQLEYRRKQVSS